MKRIEIWTKNNCGACTLVKKLLSAKSMPYIEIEINEKTKPKLLEKNPEAKQAPQIFMMVDGVENNFPHEQFITMLKNGDI